MKVGGVALECEECSIFGNNCTGRKKPCSQYQDTCSVSVTSLNLTLEGQTAFTKSCFSSELCNKGPLIINMGSSGTSVTESRCCGGDACNTARPLKPRRNTTLNGKECSVCLPDGTECKPIKCAGDETKCLEISGTTNESNYKSHIRTRGCWRDVVCVNLVAQWPDPHLGCSLEKVIKEVVG
ncbi:A2 inhibitor and Ly6 PLAUR domain-containing B-like [Podarcis lilfordi]|uniref:A2 inhibitor and Ly6 PLAUR domain-containing B-like n=1 Tax=Podarcis lilfordi TaxID=74358 RepID=A0AA35KPA6_9SAUR|nr:A2 inhibitor and Ly6 PLAUR domain-containing B-like [Podarcis lilfordi]